MSHVIGENRRCFPGEDDSCSALTVTFVLVGDGAQFTATAVEQFRVVRVGVFVPFVGECPTVGAAVCFFDPVGEDERTVVFGPVVEELVVGDALFVTVGDF